MSSTITLNEQVDTLFELSVTVHKTTVNPKLNSTPFKVEPFPVVAPDKVYSIAETPQLSEETASQLVLDCVKE